MGVGRQPLAADEPSHVLIISHDVVGPRMAGPGIRYRELARVLAQHFRVTLAVPASPDADTAGPGLYPYTWGEWATLSPAVQAAQVVILSGDVLAVFPALAEAAVPLVVDGYDPHTFETLALFAGSPEQQAQHRIRESMLQLQCRAGDFFLCASERQRDWWLGLLEANGRINVHTYGTDPSLRRLVDVVPFGLPASPLQHSRQVLKGVRPGIAPDDKVVLWGGGLWQWLDPLTAIRAMERIRHQRDDVRLVFPGTRHPNAAVPAMPVYESARQLAESLGLVDQIVFFGDWVPYEEWPNYLAEADVGLSLHLNHAETRLAFRSRILDYVWAGLPMVVTAGDATSEMVTQWGLSETVGYEDVEGVSAALLKVLDASPAAFAPAFASARAALTWEKAAAPLVEFCRHPQRAADKVAGYALPDPAAYEQRLATQGAELERLRALVQGYERGRFIRAMKWFKGLRG